MRIITTLRTALTNIMQMATLQEQEELLAAMVAMLASLGNTADSSQGNGAIAPLKWT